jgi:hypothetical protein
MVKGSKRVTILGKRWTLKLVPKHERRGHYGLCDHPESADKTITVESNHDDERVLDTVLHELLHAGAWNLDEEIVSQWATDAARILKKLGWKRETDAAS